MVRTFRSASHSATLRPVTPSNEPPASVDVLMRDLEDQVLGRLRERLMEGGGPREYEDAELFRAVEEVLRRAVTGRSLDALLVPELVGDDDEWQLRTYLRLSSHRGAVGRVIVFIKRRVLLPLTRWLYEYSLENFRRQDRVNRMLFSCVEELAIENARLRQDLQRLRVRM